MNRLCLARVFPDSNEHTIFYSLSGSGIDKLEATLINRIEIIDFLLKNLHAQECKAILSYFNNLYETKDGTN